MTHKIGEYWYCKDGDDYVVVKCTREKGDPDPAQYQVVTRWKTYEEAKASYERTIRPFNEEEKGRAREREYRNRSETFDTRLNREIRDRSINRDSRDDLYNDDLGIFDCD